MTQVIAAPKQRKNLVNVEEFERWLSKKKTDYNYEFMDGQIIKKQPMKQNELSIVQFLTRRFTETSFYKEYSELVPEIDVYIDEYRKRIPDLAYFTDQQIKDTRKGIKAMPIFIIELLSDSEGFNDVEVKINDYFNAGVQVVWYINPKTQTIHSYTSPKTVVICSGADLCSAAPALPDFTFEVRELFA